MVTISTLWYEYLHEAYQGNYGSDKSISCPTATIIHHFKKFYLREYSKDTKMFSSDFFPPPPHGWLKLPSGCLTNYSTWRVRICSM